MKPQKLVLYMKEKNNNKISMKIKRQVLFLKKLKKCEKFKSAHRFYPPM